MNVPVRITTDRLDEYDAIEAEHRRRSFDRVARAFATSVREHTERFGPLKPAPSPEERARMEAERLAQAERRADDAARGLIGLLKLTEDEWKFANGRVK